MSMVCIHRPLSIRQQLASQRKTFVSQLLISPRLSVNRRRGWEYSGLSASCPLGYGTSFFQSNKFSCQFHSPLPHLWYVKTFLIQGRSSHHTQNRCHLLSSCMTIKIYESYSLDLITFYFLATKCSVKANILRTRELTYTYRKSPLTSCWKMNTDRGKQAFQDR